MNKSIVWSIILMGLTQQQVCAQAQLGLRTDNYAGIHSLFLNPAGAASYPLSWDLNLFSTGLSVKNNILFVKDASLFTVKNNTGVIGPVPALQLRTPITPSLYYDFYNNNRPKFFSLVAEGMLPSFLMSSESGHTWGIFAQARTHVSGYDLPHIVNRYRYMSYAIDSTIHIEPSKVAGLAWTELGLNYSYALELDKNYISIGLTVKKLWGFQGGYLENTGDTRIAKLLFDSIRIQSAFIETGLTTSAQKTPEQPTGSGFSTDFGVVFIPNGTPTQYDLKWGASLHDIGAIRLTDSAQWRSISKNDIYKNITNNDLAINDKNNVITSFGQQINRKFVNADNPAAILKARSFSVLLPARLQIFVDYRMAALPIFEDDGGALYLHGLWVQPIRGGANQAMSDALAAITPRYESRWWSAALPISLHNWQQLHWGLSLRALFLTIGSDNLASWFYKGQLNGADFYMALKINPLRIEKKASAQGGRGKATKCYKF